MPEDPNADPIKLLKHSSEMQNRSNRTSKRSGKKTDPKGKRKSSTKDSSATHNVSLKTKPPYNDEHFEDMVFLIQKGATRQDVADFFKINPETLLRHCKQFYGYTFADIYKQNRAKLRMSVRQAIVHKALVEKDFRAQRYLANNLTEWSDTPEPEIAEATITYESKIGESGEVIKTIQNSKDLDTAQDFDATNTLNEVLTIEAEPEEEIKDEK